MQDQAKRARTSQWDFSEWEDPEFADITADALEIEITDEKEAPKLTLKIITDMLVNKVYDSM
eukprot:10927057-Karenia_brevis.AAC.1